MDRGQQQALDKPLKLIQPEPHYRIEHKIKGSGSVVKRKDGRWMGTLYVGKDPETSKYIRKYVYGHTKREVQEKLMLAKAEQGVK